MRLDPTQAKAVDLILEARIGVVTGGPGTGKTTTLKTALDALDETEASYALAAPTGKAARRMFEATGRKASTIHRLLEYAGHGFDRNAGHPLDVELVVVDEASMIDIRLGHALLEAIDFAETRLILIGDANQLPSVGPGRFFGDLIESEAIPVARLTLVHRSASESWVCTAAPIVLEGRKPPLEERPDFLWVPAEDSDAARAETLDVVTRRLPSLGVQTAPQVLCPQRTGTAGVDALNGALQGYLNPRGRGPIYSGKGYELREGDRVIQTRNDYGRGVMNGEVGEVVAISATVVEVDFDGRLVQYDLLAASSIRLAYALTIHKSQGSEWPWVVVLCHSTHAFMLSRQLLYTAITRARLGVVIVGDAKGLGIALKNESPTRRNTTLAARLRALNAA